jgi:T5SS/PEP-CTERM-associated repeat protein
MRQTCVARASAAMLTVACGAAASAQPVEWPVRAGGNGHLYEVFLSRTPLTWSAADAAARSSGGLLVSIQSAAENEFVFSLVASNPAFWTREALLSGVVLYHGPWLGGFQAVGAAEPGGGWGWVSGEDFVYQNWAPGEPNDFQLVPDSNENRLQFFGTGGPARRWNDRVEDRPTVPIYCYIVEYGAPTAEDRIYNVGYQFTCSGGLFPQCGSFHHGDIWLNYLPPGPTKVAVLGSRRPGNNASPRYLYFGDSCLPRLTGCIDQVGLPGGPRENLRCLVQTDDWVFDFSSASCFAACNPPGSATGSYTLTSGARPSLVVGESPDFPFGGGVSASLTVRGAGQLVAQDVHVATETGVDGRLLVDAAARLRARSIWVGNDGVGNGGRATEGVLEAAGGASIFAASARIGANGRGTLRLGGSARWFDVGTSPYGVIIGSGAGSSGDAFVSDAAGLRMQASSPLVVGDGSGGRGRLTVAGPTARVDAAGGLVVGQSGGRGEVRVGSTGVVNAASLVLGRLSASEGFLGVSGGATASVGSADVSIGDQGSGRLQLTGLAPGAAGVQFTSPGIVIGRSGRGEVQLSSGARLATTQATGNVATLGAANNGIGRGSGIVELRDRSVWTVAATLSVGAVGDGLLRVYSGSAVSAARVALGRDPGSIGAVEVAGTGSRLDVAGLILVGGASRNPPASPGFLSITEGATCTAGTGLTVNGAGVVSLAGGAISLGTPAPAATAGVVRIGSGATLAGSGRLVAAVVNDAIVRPSRVMSISGAYAQSAAGDLVCALGPDNDRIVVTGPATIAGGVVLTLMTNYTPRVGDRFAIVQASSITGRFDRLTPPNATRPELEWSLVREPGEMLVVVFCRADFNRDGTVDVFDVLDFLSCFEAPADCPSGSNADFDRDGFVDSSDLEAFLAAFDLGCT